MPQQDRSLLLDLADQVHALHAIGNSATRRTAGIRPLTSSS
jgi:hypothetical protein